MKKIFKNLLYDSGPGLISISVLLARLIIGVILFMFGSGKVLGWFHGYGIEATLQGYGKMGISELFAYLSIFTEFIGGFLLIIGLFTRPAALAVMINMFVATIITLPHGFIGQGGAQTPSALLIISIVILLEGPGVYSVDTLIFDKS